MIIKLTVFLLAIALVYFLIAAFRLRSKNSNETSAETIDELSIPYLEGLLEKFNRQLEIISHDFVSMKPDRQQRAIERIREIKEKIVVVKEVIDQIKEEQITASNFPPSSDSAYKRNDKSSVTSFAILRPSSSDWVFAQSSHNGHHRTFQFGSSNIEPNYKSYTR